MLGLGIAHVPLVRVPASPSRFTSSSSTFDVSDIRWLDVVDGFLGLAAVVSWTGLSSSGCGTRPLTFLKTAASSDSGCVDIRGCGGEGFRWVSERTDAVSGASSNVSCLEQHC